MNTRLILLDRIKEFLEKDKTYEEMKAKLVEQEEEKFRIDKEGILRYEGRIWVPAAQDLKEEILHEAHHSRYAIHPGSMKMYRDLCQHFYERE